MPVYKKQCQMSHLPGLMEGPWVLSMRARHPTEAQVQQAWTPNEMHRARDPGGINQCSIVSMAETGIKAAPEQRISIIALMAIKLIVLRFTATRSDGNQLISFDLPSAYWAHGILEAGERGLGGEQPLIMLALQIPSSQMQYFTDKWS